MTTNPATSNREHVEITEVGPRDGLQNQPLTLSAQQRAELVANLVNAGLRSIEVGSFVSPRAVPGMAGCAELVALLPAGKARYSALIPNMKGYQLAREAGVDTVNLVVAASDEMNRKNIRVDTETAMAACDEILERAASDGIRADAYVSTAWECPFEGAVAPSRVAAMVRRFVEGGAVRIIIADTTGAAGPGQVRSLMRSLGEEFGIERFACHLHDTRALALANAYAALDAGVRSFDSSLGGLGGCPFAPGASGNVATEDMALLLEQCGFATGIDFAALMAAVDSLSELLGTRYGGRAWAWLERAKRKAAGSAQAQPA